MRSQTKRDLMILSGVLGTVIVVAVVMVSGFGKKFTETVWIEKESGKGPYEMRSGSRSAEARAGKSTYVKKAVTPENLKIRYSTTSHSVKFSDKSEENIEKIGELVPVPEVKY